MRFEMEMERMKQIHQKELEDKDEELEDVHKSSQRRVGKRNAIMLTFITEGQSEVLGKVANFEPDLQLLCFLLYNSYQVIISGQKIAIQFSYMWAIYQNKAHLNKLDIIPLGRKNMDEI